MPANEQLWEARKNVLFSYAHKALLLAVAFLGFWALDWLIEQKEDFDEPNWTVTPDIARVVNEATYPKCVEPGSEKKFSSREALTAAMQERAESCVWAEIRASVKGARDEMAEIRKRDPLTQKWNPLTEEELETYTRYTSFIAREEALAGLKARAARQHIGAMLLGTDLPKNEEGIRRILDEKSGGYVIYKILWFASLLLGIGAASMLFVIILTALPITDGEGYWTERIGEILKTLPASASRTIAAPLLTAAVGVGTLAGAVATTEAGGQARFSSERKTSIEAPVSGEEPPGKQPEGPISDDGQTPTGNPPSGFVYNDYRGPREIELLLTLLMEADDPVGLQGIEKDLETIRQQAEKLVAQTETARQNVVEAINDASFKIDDVNRTARDVEARLVDVENTVSVTNRTAGAILTGVQDLQPVVTQVEQVSNALNRHVIDETTTGKGIEEREKEQAETATQTLAQSAEADPRGFFRRTFGRTLFKVGPAVPKMMSARLDTANAGADEKKVFPKALETMLGADPLNRPKFERLLRERLKVPVQGTTLTSGQIDSLMSTHLRALLRICALPR